MGFQHIGGRCHNSHSPQAARQKTDNRQTLVQTYEPKSMCMYSLQQHQAKDCHTLSDTLGLEVVPTTSEMIVQSTYICANLAGAGGSAERYAVRVAL